MFDPSDHPAAGRIHTPVEMPAPLADRIDDQPQVTPAARLVSEVEEDVAVLSDSPVEVLSVTETDESEDSPLAGLGAVFPLRKLATMALLAVVAAALVYAGLNMLPYYGLNVDAIQALNDELGIPEDVASYPYAVIGDAPVPLLPELVSHGLDLDLLAYATPTELEELATQYNIETIYLGEYTMTAAHASDIDVSQGLPALPAKTAFTMTLLAGALVLITTALRDSHQVFSAISGGAGIYIAYGGAIGSLRFMQSIPLFGGEPFGGEYYVGLVGQTAAAVGVLLVFAVALYVGLPALRAGIPALGSRAKDKAAGVATRGLSAVATAVAAAVASANLDQNPSDNEAPAPLDSDPTV